MIIALEDAKSKLYTLQEDLVELAHLMKLVATDFEAERDAIRARVSAICKKYPLYGK